MNIDIERYSSSILLAIELFWNTRTHQLSNKTKVDQGNRGAVTGGKQLDGFLTLLKKIATDTGIPEENIYTKGNNLPGFFRPTKDWDFLIISPCNKLICAIELKSQVGSFGNNFNNRTEEALGSAVDFWTAFRENLFPNQQSPWLGYLLIVEDSELSRRSVRVQSSKFPTLDEFEQTSYLDRYAIMCKKLVRERHYTASTLLYTSKDKHFGSIDGETSFESFIYSFIGHLQGNQNLFK